MSRQQPAGRVEQAEAAVAALREATRDAHAAVKDLRAAVREATELLDRLLPERVQAVVDEAVKRDLTAMGETIGKATKEARAIVFAQFDDLAATLLGADDTHDETLEAAVRRYQARNAELRADTGGKVVHNGTRGYLADVAKRADR
jgi:heme oxygenase